MPEPARTPLDAARRRAMLGLAHKAAAAFGWDEAFRRQQQATVTGCASCADMSDAQLEAWLWHLKRLGADIGVPHRPQRRLPPATAQAALRADEARTPLLRKLQAQCAAGGWPWPEYVQGISRRMWRDAAPATLPWHTPEQLRALVAALAYQLKRRDAAAR